MSHRHATPARFSLTALPSSFLLVLAAAALLLGGALAGCDSAGEEDLSGTARLEGTIVDAASGDSLQNALISVTPPGDIVGETDADGFFSVEVEIDSAMAVELTAEKDGYAPSTTSLQAEPGKLDLVRLMTLVPQAGSIGEPTVITGRVVSAEGQMVENARVAVDAGGASYSTPVGEDGSYRLEPRITGPTELTVRAISDDLQAEKVVTVFPGGMRAGVNFTLAAPSDGTEPPQGEAGTPAYIELQSVTPQSIQVQETGGTEVSRITFVVRDSADRPISLDEQRSVHFSLGNRPNGGEALATEQTPTNDNGEATVSLISGTEAGVVQVFAEVDDKDGEPIRSRPVAVTIHGGFPDEDHFTVAVDQFNFAGLSQALLQNEISVIAGDKYSNPVKPETAVYFETTGGVIEGDVLTDDLGRGSVLLQSGNPRPERGIARVTARTVNVDNEEITETIAVVFSGVPILRITSSSGDPRQAQLGQSYTLQVVDQNGNPLAPGTNIQVRAEGNEVEVGGADAGEGDVSVTLKNTPFVDGNDDGDLLDYEDVQRGFDRTKFRFKPVEDPNLEEEGTPTLEGLTITVDGPGGSASCSIDTNAAQTTCDTGTITSAPQSARFEVKGQAPR